MLAPKFSVVVVSWNVASDLRRCLLALDGERRHAAVAVTVVDNNSKDGSADLVRREFSWVTLITSPKNLGFARGCNLGLNNAPGDYFVLLNPDSEVAPGFFSDLAREFAHHPRAGVIGGHILNPDGQTQSSVRAFPTLWPLLLEVLKLLGRWPGLAPKYLQLKFDYAVSQPVDQVMGACLAVPKAVWQELGGLDENFFVWFEEVDFCKRVQTYGCQVWYSSNLTLTHQRAASFVQLTYFQRHYLYTQSLVYYAAKHLGSLAKHALLWFSLPWFAVAFILDYVVPVRPQTRSE